MKTWKSIFGQDMGKVLAERYEKLLKRRLQDASSLEKKTADRHSQAKEEEIFAHSKGEKHSLRKGMRIVKREDGQNCSRGQRGRTPRKDRLSLKGKAEHLLGLGGFLSRGRKATSRSDE